MVIPSCSRVISKLLYNTGIVLGFETSSVLVNEGDGTAEVCVVLVEGTLAREVEFTLRTANGTATGKNSCYKWIPNCKRL